MWTIFVLCPSAQFISLEVKAVVCMQAFPLATETILVAPQYCSLAVMCLSVCSFTFTAWIMSSGNCRNALPSSLLRSVVSKWETGLVWCQLLSPAKHQYLQRREQIACSHLGTSSLQFMLAEEFVNLTRTKVWCAFWNPYSLLPEFHFGHFGLGAKWKSSAPQFHEETLTHCLLVPD